MSNWEMISAVEKVTWATEKWHEQIRYDESNWEMIWTYEGLRNDMSNWEMIL